MYNGSIPNADLLYGVPAIAGHLNVRPRQAHHQIEKGGLPIFRIGGVICARRTTIANWIADQEAAAQMPVKGRVSTPDKLGTRA